MNSLIFLPFLFVSAQLSAQIVIDPGHGGKDGGTVYGKLKESDISLDLAHRLEQALRARGAKDVILTRSEDEFHTLADRVEHAKDISKSFFLSLHVNSHPSARVKGFEIYSAFPLATRNLNTNSLQFILQDLRKKGRSEIESHWEKHLQALWQKEFPGETFRTKQAPFYVLEHRKAPSLLIEVGFLSNAEDRAKFNEKAFGDHLTSLLADSVLEMWTLKAEPPTLSEKQPSGSEHATNRWAVAGRTSRN